MDGDEVLSLPREGLGAPRAVCCGPEGRWWAGVALRSDRDRRARAGSWLGWGCWFWGYGLSTHSHTGGEEGRGPTASLGPTAPLIPGAAPQKSTFPLCRARSSTVWTTQTLGRFWDITEPPHIPLTAAQPSPDPSPLSFPGSPGAGGQRPGPGGDPGPAGRGDSPGTRAPSRGHREKLRRSRGCGERQHRDPHEQHNHEEWGEPQSPRATRPPGDPTGAEDTAGPHRGAGNGTLPGGAPRVTPQHTGLS